MYSLNMKNMKTGLFYIIFLFIFSISSAFSQEKVEVDNGYENFPNTRNKIDR